MNRARRRATGPALPPHKLGVVSCTVLCAVLCTLPGLAVHAVHATLTEMELNPSNGRFEVAMQVSPADLQRALALRHDRAIDLDADDDIEELISGYLRSVFRVRSGSGAPVPPRWIGMELDLAEGWLYFELRLPDGPEGLEISNRAFFELEDDQVNTINVQLPASADGEEARKITLTLTPAEPAARLP